MTSLLLLKSMLMASALTKSKKKKKKIVLKPKPVEKLCKSLNLKCRICDEEDGEIPIFNNFVHPKLSEEILNFSGVQMEDSDDLRKHMCQNCLNLLNGCIKFREMCRKTNKKIIEMSIKKEKNMEVGVIKKNNDSTKSNEVDHSADSDSSYNIPSPKFFDKCTKHYCKYCTKVFYDIVSYRIHTKQNHKDELPSRKKSFLCDVCGKTANSRANLLVHKTTHENIFPYKCEDCPYQGRTLDLLKMHKRSHLTEDERPYRCPHCPKATTSASNLSKHIRNVHSIDKTHKCEYCDKSFSFQHDMKRHIRDIHLRQSTVECEICLKKFNTKKILRGHLHKIHKLKSEKQGRIPAYLQAQLDESCENNGDININDNEPEFIM